jgi:hypothetical protein
VEEKILYEIKKFKINKKKILRWYKGDPFFGEIYEKILSKKFIFKNLFFLQFL